jgi:hypothetical protein
MPSRKTQPCAWLPADQFQFFACCQHFVATYRESLEICGGDEPSARVTFNQFTNGMATIADLASEISFP